MTRRLLAILAALLPASSLLAHLAFDAFALAGAVLVTLGLWQIYPPAAFIFDGLVLLGLGLWGAKALARPTKRTT